MLKIIKMIKILNLEKNDCELQAASFRLKAEA